MVAAYLRHSQAGGLFFKRYRLGSRLRPKDFNATMPLNHPALPGTARLFKAPPIMPRLRWQSGGNFYFRSAHAFANALIFQDGDVAERLKAAVC